MLIEDFDQSVVNELDRVSKEAVRNQEKIEDPRIFGHVKKAIEDQIVNLLVQHTDNKAVPPQSFFKKVLTTLANKYSYMFLEDPTIEVNGMKIRKFDQRTAGGVLGVDHIPRSLAAKYRRLIDKMNGKEQTGKENKEATGSFKKTRVGHVYGADPSKVIASHTVTVDNDLIEHLKNLDDTEERERVFATNRNAIYKLLSSSRDIRNAVPGFFEDQRHCKSQFEWMTNKTIVERINQEIPIQFEYLKTVLYSWISTKDFREKAEAIKLKTAEQDGSKIPEYVFLLRELSNHWHLKRSGLIRTAEEDSPFSPHIVYCDTICGYR